MVIWKYYTNTIVLRHIAAHHKCNTSVANRIYGYFIKLQVKKTFFECSFIRFVHFKKNLHPMNNEQQIQ